MTSVDAITREVLGLQSLLGRVRPRSEAGLRQWEQLPTRGFMKPARRRQAIDRLRRLDDVLHPSMIDAISDDLGALPTLERPFRRLDAQRTLLDADFFALKRFFYQSLGILETVDGLDGLPAADSEVCQMLRRAMETIHPENAHSARFHLADELDEELAACRDELRDIRRQIKEKRRHMEARILEQWDGKFDIHGRFHPTDAQEIDDERLRRHKDHYELSTEELDILQERRQQLADEVTSLERHQRERLTRFVNGARQEIDDLNQQLVAFDLAIARVELRRQLGGCWPRFVDGDEGWLQITAGREPGLMETLGAQGVQSVDLNLDRRGTVVTGPNMGGKSVLLRLIGVVQWCAQLGLPVPGNECALVDVHHVVYIGSEQPGSSEDTEGLSSFGREVRRFVDHWDAEGPVLWLLDEPGRGTHPDEGAMLAEEIAQKLVTRGDYVVMATHFPHLAASDGFTHLQIAGLDVDDATLEEELTRAKQGTATLQQVLRRFMDYRVVEVEEGGGQVPRDARRVARALGLRL